MEHTQLIFNDEVTSTKNFKLEDRPVNTEAQEKIVNSLQRNQPLSFFPKESDNEAAS